MGNRERAYSLPAVILFTLILVQAFSMTQFVERLKAEFRVSEIRIYNEETDPNKLLGRPGQYIAKANWKDGTGTCSIEVFKTEADLKRRKEYIEQVTAIASPLTEYLYINGLTLLRISRELTPKQAEEYNKALPRLTAPPRS